MTKVQGVGRKWRERWKMTKIKEERSEVFTYSLLSVGLEKSDEGDVRE